jgi:diketogulonate reductase-like aldo/keto reductase
VIPKSTHRERIEENAQIFDFALSDADIAMLDALDQTGGTNRALGNVVVSTKSKKAGATGQRDQGASRGTQR